MNIALWILQIILGVKLLTVSYSHGLRQSQPTMQDAIRRTGGFAPSLLSLIAICALAATIGLLLPGVRGITPIAALFTAALLSGSVVFHLRSREQPKIFVSAVLLAFALLVAYGRWTMMP